jgi:hypothetical protein
VLKDNRIQDNKLFVRSKNKRNKEFGRKREKTITKNGETLTASLLKLSSLDYDSTFEEELIEYALENEKLPIELVNEYNEAGHDSGDPEDQDGDEAQAKFFATHDRITKQIVETFGFASNHYLPVKWLPYGCCHWYHPVIGLFLAKQLMPDGNSKVFRTEGHPTIYSDTYKLFVDLLVWGYLNGTASTYNQLVGNAYKPSTDEKPIIEVKKWLRNQPSSD